MQKIERLNGHKELPSIFDVLNGLVREEKEEFSSVRFPPNFLAWEGWFVTTDRFKKAYRTAVKISLMPHNAEEISLEENQLAGRLFEDLGYLMISYEEKEAERVVLSPERTLAFWERLYPKAERRANHQQESLQGFSVPDGLIIKCLGDICKIVSAVEYSSAREKDLDQKKFSFAWNKRTFPTVLGQADFEFVAPNGANTKDNARKLPFSRTRFGEFIRYVYRSYTPDDYSCTLNDIQLRSQEQFRKALDHSKTGDLTGEESAYLEKISASPNLI